MKLARRLGGLLLAVLLVAGPLAGAAGAIATPAPPVTIVDLTGQRKALYQSELAQNILLRSQLGYGVVLAAWPAPPPCHSYSGSR